VRKKTWGIATALIISLGAIPATGADVPDEQYLFTYSTIFPKRDAPANWMGAWFSDKPNYPSIPALTSIDSNGNTISCESINSEKCKVLKNFSYVANYPFCSQTELNDCIEEVFAISSTGKKINASNIEYVPKSPRILNQSSNFHPGGSSKEIFDLPGVMHKGNTTKYALEVLNMGNFTIFDRSVPFSASSYSDPTFYVAITPVNLVQGQYELISELGVQPAKFDRNCVVLDQDRCGMAQGFPANYKFGVTLRMNKQVYGWLHGRMQETTFTSERIATGVKISVVGFPTVVPSIAGGGISDQFGSALQSRYKNDLTRSPYFDNFTADRGSASLLAFEDWAPILGDRATVMPSLWSLRNIKKDEFAASGLRAGQCIVSAMKTGIGGIVTTNATAYSSGPPVFNELTQSLDYKVAAPHFDSKGNEFKGYYNLKITAETARCIYNFQAVPLQASISVVSPQGEKVIATTILRSDDKWLELTAANFGFSTPTLRVRLSTELSKPEVSAQPSVAPTPSSNSIQKKITIVCVQGKISKKVTAVNPICPKGYKKKS
jgi:hypothetical protein